MRYKVIISFLVAFLGAYGVAFAQPAQYTPMTAQGYQMKRIKADSTLHIPSFCGEPTIKGSTAKDGAIAIDTCGNILYKWTNAAGWSQISGGGPSIDTTSLSNRINARIDSLRRSNDSIFARKNGAFVFQYKDSTGGTPTDTTSLSNRINLKLNATDTASLSNRINLKLNATDTASLSNRINLKFNTADTANKWVNSVTGLNDSTIRVIKGATTTDITIRSSATVTAATRLVTSVYNNTGATIPRGSVVYISGRHSSNLPTIAPAQANNEANSYKTFALVENDITTSNSGTVIQAGNITGLNLPTSSFTDGDIVYLSPTVAGGLTITKPLAPNHICKLGSITRAHPTQGSIEIKIENGWQLDELSDISIPLVPADSVILQFSRVDSLWHDVTINNAIGTRYIRPTDTTALARKQLAAYSFNANATNAAANGSATAFRDTAGTYTGTITWTGTTAPSGATNHSFRLVQVGRMVTVTIFLVYATNGGGLGQVTLDLPSGAPAVAEPAGLTGANQNMYPVLVWFASSTNALLSNAARGFIRNNATNTANDIIVQMSSSAVNTAHITVTYYTN
jgi:hypothetical protein